MGRITPDEQTRAVSHEYFIRDTPEKVFKAITEPEWLVKWLADHAEISPRSGGRYSIGWKDGPTHQGTILEFVSGKSITLAWRWKALTSMELSSGCRWRVKTMELC